MEDEIAATKWRSFVDFYVIFGIISTQREKGLQIMAFRLPRYSELTDSQRTIINLPLNKNHVVTGAPGTGKSVIAIYRASDMCNAGFDVLMLVYNRPLMSYISSAVESLDIDAEVNTWQSWISSFYREEFGCGYPQIEGPYTYDWDEIKQDFSRVGVRYDHVIIDEAQDVPIELIESLRIISKGVSCFMDENQTISSIYSNFQDVVEVLGVRTAYKLYQNFRNTREIFDFAKLYGPAENIDIVRPSGHGKPEMSKCSNYGHSNATQLTSKMVKYIRKIRQAGYENIGVFVNAKSLTRTYSELTECLDRASDPEVFMYKAMNRDFRTIDFDEDGVYVLSFNTMKGLEFDWVLIPRCECIKSNDNATLDRNTFYVATTRAKEQLVCFYFDERSSSKYIDVFGPISGHKNVLAWKGLAE